MKERKEERERERDFVHVTKTSLRFLLFNKKKHILSSFSLYFDMYLKTVGGYVSQHSYERHRSATFSSLLSLYILLVPPSTDLSISFFLFFLFCLVFSFPFHSYFIPISFLS